MIPSLVLQCAMSPQGLPLQHRGAFSAAHGPSSLCVDFVNYLGCQDPTTAYPQWRELRRQIGVGGQRNHCRELEAGIKQKKKMELKYRNTYIPVICDA